MDWKAFLEEISDRWRLTPDQRQVFLARLADENLDKSEANVAAKLSFSEAALKKHMNAIYNRAGNDFPKVAAIAGRGKLKELRGCLKEACKQSVPLASQLSEKPEISRSSTLADCQDASHLQPTHQSPLKPGAPFPRVRLPDDFVARPEVLAAVKAKLLAEDDRTLVVSAIAGLGGLGKSVLATALVLDIEVQARFADGILWVTLGQNPDLQTMLGDWIRELDKSREAFSANTLESASRYLHTLLAERGMLLVVDDVWHAAHAEWFRVGGAGCRVLVTTREAQIEGADYHELDVMTEAEAIDLARQKLGRRWQAAQEAEVKAFARVLGYLPLALDLAANQVRDGLSWAELRSEFEVERRAVALEVLDASEAWDLLAEEQQRKYSLRACFNLSLRRLQPAQLQQFAWLGVLPEDVNLSAQVAEVLWDLPPLRAKKALIDLRRRSFLTDGVATYEGEPTYRVHDLMHDMARHLIENGTLDLEIQKQESGVRSQESGVRSQESGVGNQESKIQNPKSSSEAARSAIQNAHDSFLHRYRQRAPHQRWDKLPNDGYIYRHLTWHLEQADWIDELHALMAMSDEQGHNAWFEACDRIGQPAIFVEDVARGWRLAEQAYEQDSTGSIVLQCRYALITATLNSLVANLPIDLMAEFVKRGFWTVEQAWAYVEQMQDEEKVAEAIEALAPSLSKPLFQIAVKEARAIQDEYRRTSTLCELAKLNAAVINEALTEAKRIKSESSRTLVLSQLVKLDTAIFPEVLTLAQVIQDKLWQAYLLSNLAELDASIFPKALALAQTIQDDNKKASILCNLAQINISVFSEALAATQVIQDECRRSEFLITLAQVVDADFPALLEAAREIQDEFKRAEVLRTLAQVVDADFPALLEAAWEIQDEFNRAEILGDLAQLDESIFPDALATALMIQDEVGQARVLCNLAQLNASVFPEALMAALTIQKELSPVNESSQGYFLCKLAQVDTSIFLEAFAAVQTIQDEERRAEFLGILAQVETADFSALLEAAQSIQNKYFQTSLLQTLVHMDCANFAALLQVARLIQDDLWRVYALSDLAKLDSFYFAEALATAQNVQFDYWRALALLELTVLDADVFPKALAAAQAIQDKYRQVEVLSALADLNAADFLALLKASQAIQDEYMREKIVYKLVKLDAAVFSEVLASTWVIQDEDRRAEALCELAKVDAALFPEALAATRLIQKEDRRAEALCELAKVDVALFPEALAATRLIQKEDRRAEALCELVKVDAALLPEALAAARDIQEEFPQAWALCKLAKVDAVDFSALLVATQAIQSEDRRADVLCELSKIDVADFSALLVATQAIQSEDRRADVLCELSKIDVADFSVLLVTAQTIQSEYSRADVLSALAQEVPQDLLSPIWEAIFDLTHKPSHARSLSAFLPRLSLATLPYADWQSFLHLLAYRKRADLMPDLATLYPAICHLGGDAAMRGVVRVMGEVCGQWQ